MKVERVASRPLFSGIDIRELQEHHEQLARPTLERLSPSVLRGEESEIASKIIASLTLEFPVLDESSIYTQDNGTDRVVHVPFKGDFSLFEVIPRQRAPQPPHGEIDAKRSEILLTYPVGVLISDVQIDTNRALEEIKQHLDWLRPDIIETNWLGKKLLRQIAKMKTGL